MSIVEKMNTYSNETIHITSRCTMHLHGHHNKVVSFMKPFIFVDFNNGAKFCNYTYWLTNDIRSHRSIIITLTMKTWFSWVMYRSVCNKTFNVKTYHCSLHITCLFFWAKTYMMFWMMPCVSIYWPPNGQQTKCMSNESNLCSHSHVKKLNVKSWINPKWKCNFEMKVECAMQDENATLKWK